MDLTPFGQKLTITAIDKGILGLLLVVAGFAFNKMIEKQQHDGLCACPWSASSRRPPWTKRATIEVRVSAS